MSMLDADADLPGWAIGVVLLTGTISVAGVTDYVLTGAGYDIAGTAVWALCYLLIADLAIVYFALSSRPYDVWATVPLFAAAAGFMRMGFLRLLD